jgi:hypothetical protein
VPVHVPPYWPHAVCGLIGGVMQAVPDQYWPDGHCGIVVVAVWAAAIPIEPNTKTKPKERVMSFFIL